MAEVDSNGEVEILQKLNNQIKRGVNTGGWPYEKNYKSIGKYN